MSAQADTRRLPRPPAPVVPDGWHDHSGGVWSWMSTGRTVSVSVHVYEDGHMSPPCVVGAGKGRLVTTELERACAAIDALCRYVRARHVWGAR